MKKLIKAILRPFKAHEIHYEQLVTPRPRKGLKRVLKIEMVVFFCFLSFVGFSQAHFDIGSGIGTTKSYEKGNTTSFIPIMRLGAWYEFENRITTDAFMQVSISRQANSPNFLGAKVGYDLNGFIPSIGYLFNYANSDDHSQNSGSITYSLKYAFSVNDNGGLFIDALYSQKYFQLTAGFHVVFGNN